jgi:hypothetical protein
MKIRSEFHLRREPITLFEDVDISTYDRVGKLGPDAMGVLSASGEPAEFFYLEGGATDAVVVVAFFGGAGSQLQLKLSGTGSKGSHLIAGTNGVIEASNTGSGDPLSESEIGVALEDWTDGDAVECNIYRI